MVPRSISTRKQRREPSAKQQAERQIRHDADLVGDAAVRNLDVKRERIARAGALVRKRCNQFVRMDQPNICRDARTRAAARHKSP